MDLAHQMLSLCHRPPAVPAQVLPASDGRDGCRQGLWPNHWQVLLAPILRQVVGPDGYPPGTQPNQLLYWTTLDLLSLATEGWAGEPSQLATALQTLAAQAV